MVSTLGTLKNDRPEGGERCGFQMNLAPIRESQSLQLRGVAIRTTGSSALLERSDPATIQGASLWWLVPRVETLG